MSLGKEGVGTDAEFADELKPGTRLMLGQYTIERFLAAGGFGITYLAKDSLDRPIVIKECFPGSFCRRQKNSVMPRSRAHQEELQSIVRLFSKEALTLAKAGHPNIVGVHQVFEENNTAYMALDYVEGRDLLEILTEDARSLRPEQIQRYLAKMLDAIGSVHAKGLLHRDISPDNIIINQNDEPVLIDFGAARETADKKASRLLSALRVVKDGYSPQEFYIAGSIQTACCDFYSLAASFYHVITGELPPDSQARLTAFASGEPDPYVSLAKCAPGYPANFASALDKAMSILPKDRMQTADDWVAHIENGPADTPLNAHETAKATSEKRSLFLPVFSGGAALAAAAGASFFYVSTQEPGDRATTMGATGAAILAPTTNTQTGGRETAMAAPDAAIEAEGTDTGQVLVDVEHAAPVLPFLVPDNAEAANAPESVSADEPSRAVASLDAPSAATPDLAPVPASPLPEVADLAADAQKPLLGAHVRPKLRPVGALQADVASADAAPIEAASVMEYDAPMMPFTLATDEPGVVETVIGEAPFWLTPGLKIVSVDGVAAATNDEIRELAAQAVRSGFGEATVTLGTDALLSDAAIERRITISSERQTALLNGLVFVSREEDGVHVTRVSQTPEGSTFLVGDKVVAFMATGERLGADTTMKSILERELAGGQTSFSFAVERQGEMWVEAFNLAALGN